MCFSCTLMYLIYRLLNGGDKEYVVLPNGKKRSFKDLISHRDEITQDISTMKNFKVVRQLLETFEKLCLKSKKIQLDIDLLEIYGKVKINSLDIYLVNESGSINSVGIGNLNSMNNNCYFLQIGRFFCHFIAIQTFRLL